MSLISWQQLHALLSDRPSTIIHAQHEGPHAHMYMPLSTDSEVPQQVRWALMLDVDARGIGAIFVQGKGHRDSSHARIRQGAWEPLLVLILGLTVLDALSITTWLLMLIIQHTVTYANKALLCMIIVKRKHCVINVVNGVMLFITKTLCDKPQRYELFTSSTLIMQRLRLHFAIMILFCITQRIIALRYDPLNCCVEYGPLL